MSALQNAFRVLDQKFQYTPLELCIMYSKSVSTNCFLRVSSLMTKYFNDCSKRTIEILFQEASIFPKEKSETDEKTYLKVLH